jgi:hypothetical protein
VKSHERYRPNGLVQERRLVRMPKKRWFWVTDEVMLYQRELDARRLLIGLNFSARPRHAPVQARGTILPVDRYGSLE